jgi:hypothetical protein
MTQISIFCDRQKARVKRHLASQQFFRPKAAVALDLEQERFNVWEDSFELCPNDVSEFEYRK